MAQIGAMEGLKVTSPIRSMALPVEIGYPLCPPRRTLVRAEVTAASGQQRTFGCRNVEYPLVRTASRTTLSFGWGARVLMVSRSLKINGAELSYIEAGAGPPVVLVNGLLADQRSWRRQIEALSPKYRVFALSPRYYRPNKWPDDGAGFTVATFVADLAALLRKLDLQSVHLLGHSFIAR